MWMNERRNAQQETWHVLSLNKMLPALSRELEESILQLGMSEAAQKHRSGTYEDAFLSHLATSGLQIVTIVTITTTVTVTVTITVTINNLALTSLGFPRVCSTRCRPLHPSCLVLALVGPGWCS